LSSEQREAAQRKKKRTASKQQRQMQADTLYLAGWVLLVTTLPAEQWSAQQVAALYQARWHIELLFKRLKQLLHQQRLRCTTAATALPTLLFLLLGWALLEEESSAVRLAMRDAMHCTQQVAAAESLAPEVAETLRWQDQGAGPLSEWLLAEISVDLLGQQIRGQYTAARFRACLPRLQRFLCSGHRTRPHLYTQVCRWLGIPATDGDSGALRA
jgi:Transposase DDE domain